MKTHPLAALGVAACASFALAQATLDDAARAAEDGRPAPAAERFGADHRDHLGHWWQDAVFYEIFVRSFADSTEGPLANDGVGDLAGLIERLDYLNDGDPTTDTDLGITALWLMPIFQSPSYHGYDTVDYMSIDDEYGDNEDFARLIQECDRRGIRVVLDLVINHSSSDHPWFRAAQDPASDKRDWYVWSEDHPGWQGPWGQPVWHPSPAEDGSHYYGLFWWGMPDLNFEHEPVTEAVFEICRFWMEEMGAAGFRLDAIRHLVEDGRVQENTPETHAWLRRFFDEMKRIDPEAFTVGEVWADSDAVSRYVGDQMDVAFEFDLGYRLVDALRAGEGEAFTRQLRWMDELYPLGMYATFLRNHDQPRILHELGGDLEATRLAAAVQFCLPGVPFIYYGEEIGMTGTKPDEQLRTPMQWRPPSRAGAGVGFTGADEPWIAPQPDAETVHVEGQDDEADSMLNAYRRLIRLRRATPELRTGELRLIETDHPAVVAFVREGAHGDEPSASGYLCLFNFSGEAVTEYTLRGIGARPDADLFGGADVARDPARPVAELAPRAAHIIRLTR